MAMGVVYALIDPRTSEPRYVGWTTSPRARIGQHCRPSSLRRDKSHKGAWVSKLAASGVRPEMIVLESDPSDRCEAERFWVEYLRFLGANLTNIQAGGDIDPALLRTRNHKARPGGRWSKLQRRRQVLSAYPEKLARVEEAITRMAKRCDLTVSEAEAYIEGCLA